MTTPAQQTQKVHQPGRIDCTFGLYTYHALCGHVSTNKAEFRKEKQGADKLTCALCIVRVRGQWRREKKAEE